MRKLNHKGQKCIKAATSIDRTNNNLIRQSDNGGIDSLTTFYRKLAITLQEETNDLIQTQPLIHYVIIVGIPPVSMFALMNSRNQINIYKC